MTECTLHRHCTLTSFLPCSLSFSVCPRTDTAKLYNTQSDLCMRTPHLDQTVPLVLNRMFIGTSIIMTSHMVADTSLNIIYVPRLISGLTGRARKHLRMAGDLDRLAVDGGL